jgi:hypothetical protein
VDAAGASAHLAAREDGHSYPCFGGAGFRIDGYLGGWAPGAPPFGTQHHVGRAQWRGARELPRRRQVPGIALRRACRDPARDRRDVGLGKPADAGEVAIPGDGLPRRHSPFLHHLKDLVPAREVLVVDQREGRAPTGAMALLAVLLEQGRDVSAEGDHGRVGLLRRCRPAAAAHENCQQGHEKTDEHRVVC